MFRKGALLDEEHIGKLNDDHNYLKDNDYILSGYRLYFNTSSKIFKSLFVWHNESVNIWSHLLGFFLFVALSIYSIAFLHISTEISLLSPETIDEYIKFTASVIDSYTEDIKNQLDSDAFSFATFSVLKEHGLQKVSRWPIIVFLFSAMVCLSLSSLYHLFNAHSRKVYKLMSRLDYAGISILICGSFFPPVYYMYFCIEGNKKAELIILYLVGISFFSALVFVVALMPAFQEPKYRWFRGGIFLALGLTGIIPCINLIFISDTSRFSDGLYCYLCMALCYVGGVIIYILRLPERFIPGKLDTIGNSHNIWHLFVLGASVFHYMGALDNYYSRQRITCSN